MDHPIPKTIIQTGPGGQLSLLRRAVVTNVTALHPEFEYRFFADDDVDRFMRREFPQYRPVFDAFRFRIQRYDFFRYLAVYRFGGFYLDLDVLLASSLSAFLHHRCVVPFDDLTLSPFLRRHHGMDWTIGNYAFGAAPGHPFLWAVIQNCLRAQHDLRWVRASLRGIPRPFRDDFIVLNTTGPLMMSRTLAEHPDLAQDVTVLFPGDVRDPETWHRFGHIGIHLMEGSWRRRETRLRRRLRMLWEARLFRRSMRASARLGPTRWRPPSPTTAPNGAAVATGSPTLTDR